MRMTLTCGKAAQGGHNDKFWEATLEAYKKKAEQEQSPQSEVELKESAARLNANPNWDPWATSSSPSLRLKSSAKSTL
jgi:hypothetical protein